MSNTQSCKNLRRVFLTLVTVVACWLPAFGAEPSAIPVVSRLAGSATITSSSGTSHELRSVEPLQPGSTLTTALDSIVSVHVEQVGQVQLGPQTKTSVSFRDGWLTFQMSSGALCIDSQSQNVSVNAGGFRLAVSSPSTIYDVLVDGEATTIAVFRGGIVVGGPHMSTKTIYAGGAASGVRNGALSDVAIGSVVQDFAKLKCPDASVISEVIPPTASPAASGGGHSGTIIATLLGLAAIAAAVGHGGGSGNVPANTPRGPVMLSATSLSLRVGGSNGAITVSESGYSGAFTVAASGCGGIATIAPSSGTSFSVSPVAAGNCRISFTDDRGQIASLLAFVTTGTMFISPQTMELTGTGNTSSFTVSDGSPTTFTAISSNLTVATVTLVARTPNAATFNVTGVLSGKAMITVTDTLGGSGVVSVGVGQPPLAARHASLAPQLHPLPAQARGTMLVNMQRLVFAHTGISQVLSVSEKNYQGVILAISSDPSVAAVGQALGAGDVRTIVVISRSPGRAQIRITDDHGNQIIVAVTVIPAGGVPYRRKELRPSTFFITAETNLPR